MLGPISSSNKQHVHDCIKMLELAGNHQETAWGPTEGPAGEYWLIQSYSNAIFPAQYMRFLFWLVFTRYIPQF